MQIKKLSVMNFKSFKELNFNFKKINIILGPNNSGKSNLFRFLLLLKQTVTSNLKAPLLLNGNTINLGAYKDISYRYNSKKLSINIIISKLLKYAFYVDEDNESFEEEEEFIATDFEISYELDIDFEINKIKFVSYQIKNLKSNKSILEFKIDEYLNLEGMPIAEYNSRIIQILHLIIRELEYLKNYKFITQKNLYKKVLKITQELEIKLDYPNLDSLINHFIKNASNFKQDIIKINFNGIIPEVEIRSDLFYDPIYHIREFSRILSSRDVYDRLEDFFVDPKISSMKHHISSLKEFLKQLSDIEERLDDIGTKFTNFEMNIDNFFENLYYIGPLRNFPQRYYPISGEVASDVGFKGEFTPHILKESSEKEEKDNLLDKINVWLNKFEMASHIKIKEYKEIQEFISLMFYEFYSGLRVNLTDMGVGTSQVLPIIIEGFIIEKDSLFLVEQPEIHLHPKAQAILGDLFIELAKENKTILIETHSEHIFQRIQRRIAEGVISSNDVAFYYVTMGKEGSVIKILNLDQYGYIQNIPKGFFSEDFEEAYEHLKAVNERKQMKNKREE